MSGRLVHAEYVVTCAPPSPEGVIRDGAVYVEGSEIVEVGRFEDLSRRHPQAEVLGGTGFAALPGFVNAHHHGRGLTMIQSGKLDLPLETWILHFPAMTRRDVYWDTLAFAVSQLRSGVTSVLHSQASLTAPAAAYEAEAAQYANAYRDAGLRSAIALDIRDRNLLAYGDRELLETLPEDLRQRTRARVEPWPGIGLQEYLEGVARLSAAREERGWERVRFFLGPSAAQWCSDDVLVACRDAAERLDTGIHLHVLETWYQGEFGRRTYGESVVQHLDRLGFLGPRVSAAHSIWLTEADLAIYARSGVTVVHNPSSNMRLGAGTAPVPAMLERGIPVALGMDNMTLGDDEDPLYEMRLATYVHRAPWLSAPRVGAYQALAMATRGGARALLLEHAIGSLEPGKRADVVLLDLRPIRDPYLDPRTDVVEAIVARSKAAHVSTVLIDGEVHLRDGKLPHLDVEEIARRQRAWATDPNGAAPAERRALYEELRPYVERFYRAWEPRGDAPARPTPRRGDISD